MKRALTIQDISCFGQCSITVALPIISAMGVECAVIPTAVLSTHTGGFKGFTFRDLSDDIPRIRTHWKNENIEFGGIYTGYLGSPEQAKMIEDFISEFDMPLVFVDPAMADNGKLYAGFDDRIIDAMRTLCSKADIIVPNLTEAAFILGEEYVKAGEYDREYIYAMLKRLTSLGAKKAVLTGIIFEPDKQGAVAYDSLTGEYAEYFSDNLPIQCHGTGDVFSATMFGAMMLQKDLYSSIKIAVDYTVECIKHTMEDKSHWYGVKFEECIPYLVNNI